MSDTSVLRWIADPIGTWVFGPNDDANATYAVLKDRWGKLIASGVRVPENDGLQKHWLAFSSAWESALGHQDPRELGGMALELATAESNARSHGYVLPGTATMSNPSVVAPVHAPDPTKATMAGDAATTINRNTGGEGPPDPLLIPKAIGVGALALGTIAATASAKSDAARVGIAVGGLFVTGIAGWLAFAPAEKKKP